MFIISCDGCDSIRTRVRVPTFTYPGRGTCHRTRNAAAFFSSMMAAAAMATAAAAMATAAAAMATAMAVVATTAVAAATAANGRSGGGSGG